MGKRRKQVARPIMSLRQNSMPIDLLIQIFSRLSVKDIARCRCVSKLWSSILRLRVFTELFLKISSTRPRLLFTFIDKRNGMQVFYSLPQTSDLDRNYSSPLTPSYHMEFPRGWGYVQEICAPVLGLICSDGRKPMICNPSTGDYITLPRVRTNRADELKPYFVYEPIEKVFKVMCMTGDYSCRVSTFTLRVREMTRTTVECSIPHQPLHTEICIDGVLYYLAKCIGKGIPKPYMLVCFDVRFEKFKFVALEFAFNRSALVNYKGKVGILWSSLDGLICPATKSFELRVLEDADELKWSMTVYRLPSYWKDLAANTWLAIVGMTNDGVIVLSTWLLNDPFYMVYFNVVRNTVVRVEIQFGIEGIQHVYTFLDHVEDVELINKAL